MPWRFLGRLLYDSPGSSSSGRLGARRAGNPSSRTRQSQDDDEELSGGDEPMPGYREFVERVARGKWPSEIILNRSPEHAAAVIEFLFLTAKASVHILTHTLAEDVYGTNAVKDAAITFLRDYPTARIHILVENGLNRSAHSFLVTVDEQFASRVRLEFVNPGEHGDYKFNFAVADGESFRFEESRDSCEAFVQFGNNEFGSKLEDTFSALSSGASSSFKETELAANQA